MRTTTRRIISTRLPCAGILLVALGWPAPTLAQQAFSIDFPKKAGLPNSCMTQEPAGNGGTYLRCRIALPDSFPSHLFIRGVAFECRPLGSPGCVHTQECPGNSAICGRHVYPVVPVDFNIANPGARTVDWWGWTNDADEATLHFEVGVGP